MSSITSSLVSLILVISLSQSEKVHVINQHTCDVRENMLLCEFQGEGIYEPDRKLRGIRKIVLLGFERGSISVPDSFLPDLEEVYLEKTILNCGKVDARTGVRVYINDEICTEPTTSRRITTISTTAKLQTSSSGQVEGEDVLVGRIGTKMMIVIFLSALLGTLCVLVAVCCAVKKWRKRRANSQSLESVVHYEMPVFKND